MHRILESIRRAIRNAFPIVVPSGREGYIRLDLNETPEPHDGAFLRRLKQFNSFTIEAYPEYDELYTELTKYTRVPRENICIFNGSDNAIELLLSLFFKKNDRVVMAEPTFFVYRHILTLLEAKIASIAITESNGDAVFPTKELLAALTPKTKGLLLCNPNNPTGTVIPKEDLELLIKKTHRLGIPLIIDEAYYEYCKISALPYLKQYKNIVVIRTFSKAFGLAGLRIGYVVAEKRLIKELIKLKLPWSVSHFSAHAAKIALQHRTIFNQKLTSFKKRKKEFEAFLKEAGIPFYRSKGNFLLCKINNPERFYTQMKKRGILVGKAYALRPEFEVLKNAIRMNIPPKKAFKEVTRIIRETIK